MLVVQEVNRKWAKALNPFEYRLVSYILDRTIFWGRETFRACHNNIMNGTDDFAGVGMKRTKYLETMKSLEDRNVITRERARDFVTLGLNLDWDPKEDCRKLHLPKRVSEPGKAQKSTTWTSKSPCAGLQKSATRTQNKENKEKGNNISAEPDGSRGELDLDKNFNFDPGEKSEIVPDKNQENSPGEKKCNGLHSADKVQAGPAERMAKVDGDRKTAAEKAKTKKKPNTTDIEIVWKDAMAETFPMYNHVGWGVKQRAKVKKALSKYVYDNTITLPALLDWSVRHWPRLLRTQLFFFSNPPEVPRINFVLSEGVLRLVADAYATGELDRLICGDERDELKRLMLNGQNEREALAMIGEGRARKRMRDEINRKTREANRKLAAARDREDRAIRLEGIGERLAEAGVSVQPVKKRRPGQAWQAPPIPFSNSPAMQEKRRAERVAKPALPVPSGSPPPGSKMETWDELQARLRKANEELMNGCGDRHQVDCAGLQGTQNASSPHGFLASADSLKSEHHAQQPRRQNNDL
ncbi:hypothetical protein GC1_14685 [Leisingera sp. ANG1]|nr:hypothetical protein RA22_03250 [Leisingera sp. ANG-S]KID08398.1 hypothetical protein GC1_14685 [Leisingera sp. ANG1]